MGIGLALAMKSGENAKMFRADVQRWLRAGGAVLALALPAMGGGCGRGAPAPPPKTVSDWFTIRVGGRPVRMQVAVSEAEMAQGLMDRRRLAPDEGMLFVYPRPQALSFWMRNTPLPLDIGFFARSGELEEVYAMYPFDEAPVRSRGGALQFALEMNQGWFGAQGIRPGMRLDGADLRAALVARGVDLADYGLAPAP